MEKERDGLRATGMERKEREGEKERRETETETPGGRQGISDRDDDRDSRAEVTLLEVRSLLVQRGEHAVRVYQHTLVSLAHKVRKREKRREVALSEEKRQAGERESLCKERESSTSSWSARLKVRRERERERETIT